MSRIEDMGMSSFGPDPERTLVENPSLLKPILAAIAKMQGYQRVSFMPTQVPGVAPVSMARQSYLFSPLAQRASNKVFADFSRLQGYTGAGGAEALQIAGTMAPGATRSVYGFDPKRMGDLTSSNSLNFGGYKAFGDANPLTGPYDPLAMQEMMRRSSTFTRSFMELSRDMSGPVGKKALQRNAALLGDFSDDEALELTHGELRRGNRQLTKFVGNDNGSYDAVVNEDGLKQTMGMFNALRELVDDKTVANLNDVMNTMSQHAGAELDPVKMKESFQKLGHLAKSLGIGAKEMFSAAQNIKSNMFQSTGMDIGIEGATRIAARGLGAAEEMGVTTEAGRVQLVTRRAQAHADAMSSSGAAALIQLTGDKTRLTDSMKAQLSDPAFTSNAAAVTRLHAQVYGDSSQAMLRNRGYTTSMFSGLSDSEKSRIGGIVDQGWDSQVGINISRLGSADAGASARNLMRSQPGYDAGAARNMQAWSTIHALKDSGGSPLFSADAKEDQRLRGMAAAQVDAYIAQGMTPSDAVTAAKRVWAGDSKLSAGLENLTSAENRLQGKAAVDGYRNNKRAAILSKMGEGVRVDRSQLKAMLASGTAKGYGDAENLLSKALGTRDMFNQRYADTEAGFESQVKGIEGWDSASKFQREHGLDALTKAEAVQSLSRDMSAIMSVDPADASALPSPERMSKLYSSLSSVMGKDADGGSIADALFKGVFDVSTGTYAENATGESVRGMIKGFTQNSSKYQELNRGASALNTVGAKLGAVYGDSGVGLRDSLKGQGFYKDWGVTQEKEQGWIDKINEANPNLGVGEKMMGVISTALTGGDISQAVYQAMGVSVSDKDTDGQKQLKLQAQEEFKNSEQYQNFNKALVKARESGDPAAVANLVKSGEAGSHLVNISRSKAFQQGALTGSAFSQDPGQEQIPESKAQAADKELTISGILTLLGDGTAELKGKTKISS